ncbi:uncharacterized protein N7496_009814 [Penicillium cataractarum]|uniref:Uncharacterized protein n=1 Tax=Penicillium cataractarum TaxID=2100454 RepID=A0A9W9RQ69_9EURO|nr:uncharacterized protein N7496_009814 [Penicillium cataractarum]KAJ5364101.1 hypothetical protein N7496_009814 [Penicillium cataractarum]
MSKTFPRQVPAQGLVDIHRLTFWWSLRRDSQPHLSRKNRIQYDKFWVTLQKTFVNLTEIRVFVDTIGLADMKSIPEDMVGDTDEEKQRYIQSAWLDEMESMIEAKQKLKVFEIHIDNGVYRHVKERIQPWLKEKEEERKTERKIDRIRYKAYRCKHTNITYQGVPASRPISRGSSKIGIEDSRSVPDEFWRKNISKRGK